MSAPHTCHWPGCEARVPPRLWGCKRHWYTLPKTIRDRIWATYRRGQERDKAPSAAYLDAAREARDWALAYEKERLATVGADRPVAPRSRLPDQPPLL